MKLLALFLLIATGSFVVQSIKATKYPVVHTRDEWAAKEGGLLYVQDKIRTGDWVLPANELFSMDSVLQSQLDDIRKQVLPMVLEDARKQADSTLPKKKP